MTPTLAALEGDCTLLTVNNRLALELRGRYDRMQIAAGRQAWPSADILPWTAWLRRSYDDLLDRGQTVRDLLSGPQERLLWEAIIRRDPDSAALLQPSAAAQTARDAFALCTAWRLEPKRLDALGGDDTRTFLRWRESFSRRLRQDALITEAELPELIATALRDGQIRPPGRLLHSGFDSLTPCQRALFDALAGQGCQIDEYAGERQDARRMRVIAADTEHEIRLAAHWAREQLRHNPACRIGIVSPRIRQQRRDLERIFTQVLAPHSYLGDPGEAPFDISLGEALATHRLVADALGALRLLLDPQPVAEIGRLLRSPFVGGHGAEWEQRALFDVALRDEGLPRYSLERLVRRLKHYADGDLCPCPDLLSRLRALQSVRADLPRSASPGGWAQRLQQVLHTLGWPGERSLDSIEYQQYQRFEQVFSTFAQLAKVRPRLSLGEAVAQLATLAGETVFQPRRATTPVRLLGALEAAGMDFDRLWLLGLDDQAWPPPAQPHPLLPAGLQRELGMPHASAERELAFASALTERLAGSAAEVIASHARQSGERAQGPSPLIAAWPLREATAICVIDDTLRAACGDPTRWQAQPLTPLPPDQATLAGGASLLAAQAACPFQAVARFRLQARPLGEPSFAPDATLNGTLIHALMQAVWQQIKDSNTLADLDDAALDALLRPLVEATLADVGRARPDLYGARFQAIETERLTRLATAWLQCERERSQEFAVVALEQRDEIELGGLRLKTRTDRIDRLADNSLAIIDYKTGRDVRDDGWFDDRLSEPQLPLYCLQEPAAVGAILLARVRRDAPGCGLVGLSREPGFAPGVTTAQERTEGGDWSGLLEHWGRAIGELADELRNGRADPTPSRQACEYCRLGALCRVRARADGEGHG